MENGTLISIKGNIYEYVAYDERTKLHIVTEVEIDNDGNLTATYIPYAFTDADLKETEEVDHLVLADDSTVEVTVTRGPGILLADNSPERITVNEGDTVIFSKSADTALIFDLAGFMCPKCRLLRHPNKLPFAGLKNQ